jgi:peptidase C13-like protein/thrombospondin type 3 repeat protein
MLQAQLLTAATRRHGPGLLGGGGTGWFRYSLDNPDLGSQPETSTTSYNPSSALPDGEHTLYVQERNDPNNWSASGSFKIDIDTGNPCSNATSPPAHINPIESIEISYTSDDIYAGQTCGSGTGSGLDKVELWVKPSGATQYILVDTDYEGSIDGKFDYSVSNNAAEGAYCFYTLGTDKAGNEEDRSQEGEYDTQTIYTSKFSGYAILGVGAIPPNNEGISDHTITANNVYKHLVRRKFTDDTIKYFNPKDAIIAGKDDYTIDPENPGGDPITYKQGLEKTIKLWALNNMQAAPGPLYIILIDHGATDVFYLEEGDYFSANDLNDWLCALENGMATSDPVIDQPIVLIIGSCKSGSFINDLSDPSKNRIIVTSTANNESSYRGTQVDGLVTDGEFFITSLFNELGQGLDLKKSFLRATERTEIFTDSGCTDTPYPYFDSALQHPHLDDNGINDGEDLVNKGSNILYPGGDGDYAELITLGWESGVSDPLTITEAGIEPTEPLQAATQALLWAKVDDPDRTSKVWVEIRGAGDPTVDVLTQKRMALENVELFLNGDRYQNTHGGFNDPGKYTLYFYVRDNEGFISPFKRKFLYKENGENISPSAPGPLSPTGFVDASAGIGFIWEEATDNDLHPLTYTLEVREGSTWSSGVVFYKQEGIVRNSHIAHPEHPEPVFVHGTTYQWQVTAIDEYGAETPSGVSSFTVDNQNSFLGWIAGLVYAGDTSLPLLDALVRAQGLNLAMTGQGYYFGIGEGGNYDITVSASGYETRIANISIPEGAIATRNFSLAKAGDTDGDGMPDDWEDLYPDLNSGSDDAGGDIDGDGLINLDEYLNGTNPTLSDTDGDGMPDGWEVFYNLDPLVNDANADSDKDEWTNLKEYQRGTDPKDSNSHPTKAMPWLMLLLQ